MSGFICVDFSQEMTPGLAQSQMSLHMYEVFLHINYIVLYTRRKLAHSRSAKIIGIEWLAIEIEAEQVSASEDAKFDRFALFLVSICPHGITIYEHDFTLSILHMLFCAKISLWTLPYLGVASSVKKSYTYNVLYTGVKGNETPNRFTIDQEIE